MHQTPEQQKRVLKTSWIAGAIFLFIYGFLFLGEGSKPGSILVREQYAFLIPYVYILLLWSIWSWDLLVTKNYIKAGIMFAIAVGCWALNEFVVKNDMVPRDEHLGSYLKRTILLSSFFWMCIARAILEFDRKRSVAMLLTGLTVHLLITMYNQGQSGLSVFALPYLLIIDYVLSGNMQQTLTNFVYSPLGIKMMTLFTVACYTFLLQWVYQFFYNFSEPARRNSVKGIFGKEFPKVSGRYFAATFPIFYVLTISAASCVVIYAAQLLLPADDREYITFRSLRSGIAMVNVKGLAWIMLPISIFFTIMLFRVTRTLTLARCITLHKKFGLTYLLSFVPFLNIITWIVLSVTRTPTDEHAKMQYASEMNHPLTQRSIFTVNLLITLSILNAAFTLITGLNSGGGAGIGFIIVLLTISMYIGFVYRPDMIYGVIGVRLVFLAIVLFSDRLRTGDRVLIAFFTIYGILMLYWQMRIFHPEIEMPVEVKFDGEEGNGD